MRTVLIAESGSTKTDWVLADAETVRMRWQGPGINPESQAREEVVARLRDAVAQLAGTGVPAEVAYYGAGLGNPANCRLVAAELAALLPGAEVHAHHDMLAAARALGGHAPGIICILGTGSNSCRYDGREVVEERGGHGYLFGDEGGGADLGRALLTAALNGWLPAGVCEQLITHLGCTLLDFRKHCYQAARPNLELAPLTRFIGEHVSQPALQELVRSRFLAFLDATVCRYAAAQDMPVHVTGSVGWHFQDLLREAMEMRGLQPGNIVAAPAAHLIAWHQAQFMA